MKKYLVLFLFAIAVFATGSVFSEQEPQKPSIEGGTCIPCGGN